MTDIEAVVLGLKKWAVVHAENEAVLAAMVADSVDHTITDPPYNERTHTKARTLKGGGSDIPIDFDPFSDYSQVNVWLGLTRRWVIAFCALEQLGFYEQAAGPWVKNQQGGWVRAGVWHRTDGTPQLSADRPAQGAEGIAILHGVSKGLGWNSGGKRGIWTHGVERAERHHPTPKPLPLMLELLQDFTLPGEVILDPFCGSGTTGVAALRLGRRFIGIEKDAGYAKVARERLEAEERGLDLSAARSGQMSILDY